MRSLRKHAFKCSCFVADERREVPLRVIHTLWSSIVTFTFLGQWLEAKEHFIFHYFGGCWETLSLLYLIWESLCSRYVCQAQTQGYTGQRVQVCWGWMASFSGGLWVEMTPSLFLYFCREQAGIANDCRCQTLIFYLLISSKGGRGNYCVGVAARLWGKGKEAPNNEMCILPRLEPQPGNKLTESNLTAKPCKKMCVFVCMRTWFSLG